MFQVTFLRGDQWKVVDDEGETAFVGTKREVEDWLDFHDNARWRHAPPGAWLRHTLEWLRRLFAGEPGARFCFAICQFQPV